MLCGWRKSDVWLIYYCLVMVFLRSRAEGRTHCLLYVVWIRLEVRFCLLWMDDRKMSPGNAGKEDGSTATSLLLWTPSKVDLKVRDNMFLHHSTAYEE